MSAFLAMIAPWMPWVLGSVVALALAVGLYIAYLVLARTAPEEKDAQEEAPAEVEGRAEGGILTFARPDAETNPIAVRLAFRRAFRTLREFAPRTTARQSDPWVLMIGPEGAGKSDVLSAVALPRPLPGLASGIPAWHVFDQGVVLDVPGSFVRRRGGGSDHRSWQALLASLVHYRPDRPADGVVLTIPASALLGRGVSADSVRALAESLFAALKEAQSELGLRMPTYVLVTGIEEVAGFGSYAERLPERMRAEAFGWATPYSLDTAFQDEWVGEAFRDVYRRLTRTSTEMLASRGDIEDPVTLFRFPDRFRELELPLQALLASLFRESAYHESFFLRGIFFSGKLGSGAAAVHDAPPLPGTGRALFATGLFQRKIFPERGLATAYRTSVLHRNRRIRALQVAALAVLLFGGPGMFWGHRRLSAAAASTEGVLTELHRDMSSVTADRPGRSTSTSTTADEDRVFALLEKLAAINLGRFGSVFLPTSLLSGLDRDIEATLEMGFQQVVLPVMRQGILDWGDTLSDGGWARAQAAEAGVGPEGIGEVATLPEYYALRSYLQELVAYAHGINTFNTLSLEDEGTVDQLAELIEWYFEKDLPSGFRQRSDFYGRALRASRATAITRADQPRLDPASAEVAAVLVEGIYEEFFRRLEALDLAVDQITSGSAAYGVEELRRLQGDIAGVERFLQSSDAFWLQADVPPDSVIQTLLDSIGEAPILSGRAFRERFLQDLEGIRALRLVELERRLPAFSRVLGSTRLVNAENAGAPVLAPGLVELNAGLQDLLTRGFMASGPARPAAMVPSFGSRPTWDTRPLDGAVALFEDLRDFQSQTLPTFPVSLQGPVADVARRAMRERVREAIDAAMTYEVVPNAASRGQMERDLASRVASFDEAAKRLVQLMEMDESSGGFAVSEVLAEVILLEVLDLLQAADALLEDSPPYGLAGGTLGNWNLGRPAAWAAFGVPDAAGLEAYLAQQRESVRSVAQTVSRALGYTTLPPVDRLIRVGENVMGQGALARLVRWRGILRTLDQYGAQTPGSSLANLETFVRTGMAARGAAECPRDPVSASGNAGDYFVAVQERLARAYNQRCGELARIQVETAYARLREHFFDNLNGRFPFVAPEATAGAPDADPAAVRAFVDMYTQTVAPLGGDAAAVFATLPGGQEASAFIRRLGELRPLLLLALGTPEDPASARVGYRVEFRAHREAERGADQIAEWSLTVGGRRAAYGDNEESRTGVWRPREDVALTLRWASGSPQRPAGDTDPSARVEGPAIAFTHRGPWALLRLLAAHRAAAEALPPGTTADAGTLRFAVATAPAGATSGGERTGPGTLAIAFVRVRLTDPTSGASIPAPPFPTSVPALPGAR